MSDNVPQIRFKNYTTPWETCKLSDLFDKAISNNTLSRADLNYENGEVKNIHYGDILVKFGTFVDPTKDNVPFISNGKADDYEGKLLRDGDIVFADAAEDITVGKMVEVINENEINIVSGLHTIAYRPNKTMPSYFWGYYMNSNAYRRQLLPLMQGIKVLSLSRTNLSKTAIRYPCTTQEQTAIGNFFKTLDALTSLQTNKLEKLKTLKRAYLQQLFPQEEETTPRLRFADFDGEWVQCKLGEVLIERSVLQTPSSETPLVSFTVEGGVTPKSNRYNREFLVKEGGKKYKLTKFDDIVYNPANLKFGAISRNKFGNAVFSPIYVTFETRGCALSPFLEMIVTNPNFIRKSLAYQEGTVYERMAVKPNDFLSLEVFLPTMCEQNILGKFFTEMDEKIKAQGTRLEKLKLLKQAYLQKMFV